MGVPRGGADASPPPAATQTRRPPPTFQVISLNDTNPQIREYKRRKPHKKTKAGCLACKQKRVKVRFSGHRATHVPVKADWFVGLVCLFGKMGKWEKKNTLTSTQNCFDSSVRPDDTHLPPVPPEPAVLRIRK
jgi:hypothetical protein